jgi:hypothetical protein
MTLCPPLNPGPGITLESARCRHGPLEPPSGQEHADNCLADDDATAFQFELTAASGAAPGRLKRERRGLLGEVGRPLCAARLARSPPALQLNSGGLQSEEGPALNISAPGCLETSGRFNPTPFFLQGQQLLPRKEHPKEEKN